MSIIWFVIWLLVGVWAYKDAEQLGKSGLLAFLLIFLLGPIGLIIWYFIRTGRL